MSLKEQLESKINSVLSTQWSYADAQVVPETKSIGLGNYGKKLNATVLYADLDDSTNLVRNYRREFAAEIYKIFLYCASRHISDQGGSVRSFDGDRVMGVFQGDRPNTSAVKAALKLKWTVDSLITPKLKLQYPNSNYQLKYTVGIDNSEVLVVRGGVRDNNDLSWIGNAANIAAKLNNLSSDYPTWITHRVYDKMLDEVKFGGNPRRHMWEQRSWIPMNKMTIYRSHWRWSF